MMCICGDLEESPLIWGPWWFGAGVGSRGGIRGRQAARSGHNSPSTPAHEEPEVTNWTLQIWKTTGCTLFSQTHLRFLMCVCDVFIKSRRGTEVGLTLLTTVTDTPLPGRLFFSPQCWRATQNLQRVSGSSSRPAKASGRSKRRMQSLPLWLGLGEGFFSSHEYLV